jgi:hypothetical protein
VAGKERTMTAMELRDVFLSPAFKEDLGEMSTYLASIMQERPIVCLLAKHLSRRGKKVALEEKRHDLTVDGTTVELKFMFIPGAKYLEDELKKWPNLDEMWAAVQAGQKSRTWGVMPKIYKDICCEHKRAHIFVWIICSRDLSQVADVDLKRICVGKAQRKLDAICPYKSHRKCLSSVDEFLKKLSAIRPFSVVEEEIATTGEFPSTYYLRICEFQE